MDITDILKMSVSAGVLVLGIVAVRALGMDRLPKTMFIALWGIVLCRLLVPFSIPSGAGLYTVINRISEALLRKAGLVNGSRDMARFIYKGTEYTAGYYIEVLRKPVWTEPARILWIVGAMALALFFAVSYFKCRGEIRTALPIEGNGLIEKWLSGHKTNRPLKILMSDRIKTPLACGILKPKIILPRSVDFNNELQLNYILTHEYVHIKRFDGLWKLLLIVALCCHWFNPMVWVLYLFMSRDMEIACDERVLRLLGESSKSGYALTLIEMAEGQSGFTPLYSSFSKNAIEERILSIMKFKKTSFISLALAFILVTAATSVFAESTAGVIFKQQINFIFQYVIIPFQA